MSNASEENDPVATRGLLPPPSSPKEMDRLALADGVGVSAARRVSSIRARLTGRPVVPSSPKISATPKSLKVILLRGAHPNPGGAE